MKPNYILIHTYLGLDTASWPTFIDPKSIVSFEPMIMKGAHPYATVAITYGNEGSGQVGCYPCVGATKIAAELFAGRARILKDIKACGVIQRADRLVFQFQHDLENVKKLCACDDVSLREWVYTMREKMDSFMMGVMKPGWAHPGIEHTIGLEALSQTLKVISDWLNQFEHACKLLKDDPDGEMFAKTQALQEFGLLMGWPDEEREHYIKAYKSGFEQHMKLRDMHTYKQEES